MIRYECSCGSWILTRNRSWVEWHERVFGNWARQHEAQGHTVKIVRDKRKKESPRAVRPCPPS